MAFYSALLATVLAAAAAQDLLIKNTTYGMVQGSIDSGIAVFHSIPFAAPPTGPLRFRAPQPPTPWSGVKDATGQPNICPQIKIDGDIYLGNEDCLYLHVYAPTGATEPLPVLFWIFGGGYLIGDGYEFGLYDGTTLAQKRNVIIVAPNYRVGPFGFMALDPLQREDPHNSTGNAGLQDQTAALQWVQDNIATFGGDPNRVTIFGESAGGFSVCWHMVNEASEGLFQAAIMESGSCDSPQFFQSVDFAKSWNTIYAEAVGCNVTEDELLPCMRATSTEDMMKSILDMLNPNWPFTGVSSSPQTQRLNMTHFLINDVGVPSQLAAAQLPALAPIMPWGPAIDDTRVGLKGMPLTLMQQGRFHKVPFVAGTNLNEGSIFIPFFPLIVPGTSFPPSDSDLPLMFEHALDMYNESVIAPWMTTIMALYPPYPLDDNWARGSDMLTHYFFTCSARRAVRAVAAAGVPTYLYHFSYNIHWIESILLGDYHMSELFFVFPNQWPPILHMYDDNDWYISDAFTSFWSNFAYTQDPNLGPSGVDTYWPPYNSTSDQNVEITQPLGVTTNLDANFCDVWDQLYYALNTKPQSMRRSLQRFKKH